MTPTEAEEKCAKILDWADSNSWARENFDATTIKSIYDAALLSKYDWPTINQADAIENVYKLCSRAKSWGERTR